MRASRKRSQSKAMNQWKRREPVEEDRPQAMDVEDNDENVDVVSATPETPVAVSRMLPLIWPYSRTDDCLFRSGCSDRFYTPQPARQAESSQSFLATISGPAVRFLRPFAPASFTRTPGSLGKPQRIVVPPIEPDEVPSTPAPASGKSLKPQASEVSFSVFVPSLYTILMHLPNSASAQASYGDTSGSAARLP